MSDVIDKIIITSDSDDDNVSGDSDYNIVISDSDFDRSGNADREEETDEKLPCPL